MTATCVGKVRYQSRRNARLGRKKTHASAHLNIYSCPFCGFYHLGTLPTEVRRGELDKGDWYETARA